MKFKFEFIFTLRGWILFCQLIPAVIFVIYYHYKKIFNFINIIHGLRDYICVLLEVSKIVIHIKLSINTSTIAFNTVSVSKHLKPPTPSEKLDRGNGE